MKPTMNGEKTPNQFIFRSWRVRSGTAALRLAAVMLLAGIWLAPAAAQNIGDPRLGQTLARDVCAACHGVNAGAAGSPVPEAPTFETIARSPGMSEIALNVALHTLHRSMPNIVLSAPEVRNVIAYILSLK